MNHFTISDVENLTRIKAHTLRIWEQRYGLFIPKRSPSGHRYYDGDDLIKLLRISTLYFNGYKISRIAQLSEEEIKEKAILVDDNSRAPEQYLNSLTEASIELDETRFREFLHAACEKLGFESTVIKVVFPFLKRIGLFWLTGHVIPAQEHFASALITQKLILEIDRLPEPVRRAGHRNVLLFTPEGEHHEIPLLFTAYRMKKNGVSYVYMGKSTSLQSLRDFYAAKPASQLYFHLITNLTRVDLGTYLQLLSSYFPQAQIFFSGRYLQSDQPLPKNVQYLADASALQLFSS